MELRSAAPLCDSGRFDWSKGNFPEITQPDPSYHGLVFWEPFGLHDKAIIRGAAFILKARVTLLRDIGPALSPFNAFLFLQGLETLPLRIKAHSENAYQVALWLKEESVRHLGELPATTGAPRLSKGQEISLPGSWRYHRIWH